MVAHGEMAIRYRIYSATACMPARDCHALQELLRNCLHEDAREQHADLVAHLAKEPAPPCSLIGFTLDFRRTGGKPITELALLGRVDGPGQVDLFGRVDALRRASGRPR